MSGDAGSTPIPEADGPWRVCEARVDRPQIDAIRSEAHRDVFAEVCATSAAEVAVLPAMPAALAVEFGRVAALGANTTLAVWNRTGSGWEGPWRM